MKIFKIIFLVLNLVQLVAHARVATTTSSLPGSLPVLGPNPNNVVRTSSVQTNDPLPLIDLVGFNRVDSTTVPNAFCNDGSKPAYYLRQGTGQGSKRWIIWLEGGGGCGSSDSTSPYWCGARKNTSMWTSNNLPVFFQSLGMFSALKNSNPDFYSYNHVLIHYCSSDFWRGQGIKKVINQTTNEQWWFSGQKIVEAVLKDLEKKFGFTNATNIILTGTSAGAIGITMNSNMIKDLYPTKDIVTLIDAGWANDFPRFDPNSPGGFSENAIMDPQLMYSSYEFTGLKPSQECLNKINYCPPNSKCIDRSKLCMLSPYAAQYLKVPYFIVHDHYDRVLGYLGFSFDICKYTDRTKYETWLNNYNFNLSPSLNKALGFFQTRFGQHGLISTNFFTQYKATNNTTSYSMNEIFSNWYFNKSNVPQFWMEAQSATLSPDQETRNKNNCAITFP